MNVHFACFEQESGGGGALYITGRFFVISSTKKTHVSWEVNNIHKSTQSTHLSIQDDIHNEGGSDLCPKMCSWFCPPHSMWDQKCLWDMQVSRSSSQNDPHWGWALHQASPAQWHRFLQAFLEEASMGKAWSRSKSSQMTLNAQLVVYTAQKKQLTHQGQIPMFFLQDGGPHIHAQSPREIYQGIRG